MNRTKVKPRKPYASPFDTREKYEAALVSANQFWSDITSSAPPHPGSVKSDDLDDAAAAVYAKTIYRVSTLLGMKANAFRARIDHKRTDFKTLYDLSECFLKMPPAFAEVETQEREDIFENLRGQYSMQRAFPNIAFSVANRRLCPPGFIYAVARCLRRLEAEGYDPEVLKTVDHANAALAHVALQTINWKAQDAEWKEHTGDNLRTTAITSASIRDR